jgi:hypothetical protein
MSATLRFAPKIVGVAVFGLMAMMSGARAHAQSQSITIPNFSVSGSPGGYNDVTDTLNFGIEFDGVVYGGSYEYTVLAVTTYYAGANGAGTVLGNTNVSLYSSPSIGVHSGNNYNAYTLNFNTPGTLRASEPAGTQSIRYQYVIYAGGGCGLYYGSNQSWSGGTNSAGPTNIVHG